MLYFITGNAGKFKEVAALIPHIKQLDLDLDEIQTLDPQKVIEHKLAQAASHHDGAFIVEDTSVGLACLNGLPGTLMKWFLGSLGVEKVSELVHHYTDHTATVRTTIGYRDEQGTIHYFLGEYSGQVVKPRGTGGFGFDPIFIADGQTCTNAELTSAEKNAISSRGKAVRQLAAHLKSTLKTPAP